MTEGRAYELGSHRWHVECFRCSSCEDQLTAHTNMLVLGDGTLVCANCSYSCAVCDRKIMDMAVLTNDQAFCASCFVCRNCKNRIDDLQYARTSQGIFCMSCHNALLARKRQRQLQRQQAPKSGQTGSGAQIHQNGSTAVKSQDFGTPDGVVTPSLEPSPSSQYSRSPTPQDLRGSQGSTLTQTSQHSQGVPQNPQASLRTSRNKDLPDLPGLSLDEEKPKRMRVPRKQLAPSALQSLESLALEKSASTSSVDSPADREPSTPKREPSTSHLNDLSKLEREPSLLHTPQHLRSRESDSQSQTSYMQAEAGKAQTEGSASQDSEHTAKEPPKSADFKGSDPNITQLTGTEFVSPGVKANGASLGESSELNVPLRSQLRPASPAKSWRSQASDFSPRASSGVPLFGSPTQAAAPSQPRAFGRIWHRREPGSTASTDTDAPDTSPKSIGPLAELGHKRSASENTNASPTEQVQTISVECSRLVRQRGSLEAEVQQLEQRLARLRDAQKVLVSRNKQLTDMNAELERQTLEKFGPNSLWGSQNPPVSQPEREAPLVTRLEPLPAAQQAQFLPFKQAKQWLFRKPKQEIGLGGSGLPMTGLPGVGLTSGTATINIANGTGSSSANANANSIIGDSLAHRVQVDQSPVPYLVRRCFAEVERRGLDTEGLYRKPGSKSQVDSLLEQFGPQGDSKLGEELLGGEIQAVTSAVKQYLRHLAVPVITYDCYEAFIAAGNSKNIAVLRRCVKALPPEHIATLQAVVNHLALVASHEHSNLMNTRNLAMVFAPTISRDETGDREIPDMQARNEATHMLIVSEDIF